MDLFSVERYSFGDEAELSEVDPLTEQKRLDALKTKIIAKQNLRFQDSASKSKKGRKKKCSSIDVKGNNVKRNDEVKSLCTQIAKTEERGSLKKKRDRKKLDPEIEGVSKSDEGDTKPRKLKRLITDSNDKIKGVTVREKDDFNDAVHSSLLTALEKDLDTNISDGRIEKTLSKENVAGRDLNPTDSDVIHDARENEEPGTATSNSSFFQILGKDKKDKVVPTVKRTLPKWVREPILISGDVRGGNEEVENVSFLSHEIKKKLISNGFGKLFPVQSVVIPYILSQVMTDSLYGLGGLPPRDVLVAAPTGSGKTLSYALPIVQILTTCLYRALRCLVIVPSKELASQIKKVFSRFTLNTNLNVGMICGLNTFKSEQEMLVCRSYDQYFSNVDILVCTPGRLVDHLLQTKGFSLEDLRFLVIDEADRLLSQEYSNWSDRIMEEVYGKDNKNLRFKDTFLSAASLLTPKLPFQKLLFSATLTQNPEKLAPLRLYRPILCATGTQEAKVESTNSDVSKGGSDEGVVLEKLQRYVLPSSLEQRMLVCRETLKPLVVLYLMVHAEYKGVLCFTKSKDSTHRLFLLTQAFGDIRVAEFSAALTDPQRKGVIRDFTAGKIDLLISTDAMARGIDIDNVKVVISYDPPVNIKTYIHRVGRTARAGQKGFAVTLLIKKEAYHFKKELGKLGERGLKSLGVKYKDLEPFTERYDKALQSLSELIAGEKGKESQRRKRVSTSS